MPIDNNEQHREIMELLPWFVNQTLDEQQSKIVSDHLEHCEECQGEVKLLETMNAMTRSEAESNYHQHADIDKDLINVMDRIDASESKSQSTNREASFFSLQLEKISEFLAVSPTGLRFGTAIAGLLVVVLGFQFYQEQSSDDYSVLSSSELDQNSIRLSIKTSLSNDRSDAQMEIRQLIEKHGTVIAIDSKRDGEFVAIVKDDIDVNELVDIVTELEDKESIKRVEIIP